MHRLKGRHKGFNTSENWMKVLSRCSMGAGGGVSGVTAAFVCQMCNETFYCTRPMHRQQRGSARLAKVAHSAHRHHIDYDCASALVAARKRSRCCGSSAAHHRTPETAAVVASLPQDQINRHASHCMIPKVGGHVVRQALLLHHWMPWLLQSNEMDSSMQHQHVILTSAAWCSSVAAIPRTTSTSREVVLIWSGAMDSSEVILESCLSERHHSVVVLDPAPFEAATDDEPTAVVGRACFEQDMASILSISLVSALLVKSLLSTTPQIASVTLIVDKSSIHTTFIEHTFRSLLGPPGSFARGIVWFCMKTV